MGNRPLSFIVSLTMSFLEIGKYLGFSIVGGLVLNLIWNFGYGLYRGYFNKPKNKNGK